MAPTTTRSACLVRGGDRVWRYVDHHRLADPPTLTLAEVHCALVSGAVRRLRGPS
jgi:hypothetical protein